MAEYAATTPPICNSGSSTCNQQQALMQTMTMMNAQSNADTQYDHPPTPSDKPAKFVTGFCDMNTFNWSSLFVVGSLCLIYGIVAK
jgi:hypothetical protein